MAKETIRLKAEHLDSIRKHGEAAFPYECCGLLLGRLENGDKFLEELYPVSNAWEENAQHHRFLISPDRLIEGENYARRKNLEVLGFYHSHPEAEARPSSFDLEHAWPFYSYIIVSIKERQARELSSWRMTDDRTRFDPEPMILVE